MYCSKCGSKIDEGSAFCLSCGQPVEAKETLLPDTQQQTAMQPAKRLGKKMTAILASVAVVIVVICVFAFAHHAKENQIVGYWANNQGVSFNLVFLNQSEVFSDGHNGTYKISGNTMTFTFSGDTVTSTYSIKDGVLTLKVNKQNLTFVKMNSSQIANYKQKYKLK